eukprot:6591127-Pyramimonas_sp.AAC.2
MAAALHRIPWPLDASQCQCHELEKNKADGYTIHIIGHSLGAGVAALLTLLINRDPAFRGRGAHPTSLPVLPVIQHPCNDHLSSPEGGAFRTYTCGNSYFGCRGVVETKSRSAVYSSLCNSAYVLMKTLQAWNGSRIGALSFQACLPMLYRLIKRCHV